MVDKQITSEDSQANDKQIGLRLSSELVERIDKLAKSEGVTRTVIIERFIIAGLREGGVKYSGRVDFLMQIIAHAIKEDPTQGCETVIYFENEIGWRGY